MGGGGGYQGRLVREFVFEVGVRAGANRQSTTDNGPLQNLGKFIDRDSKLDGVLCYKIHDKFDDWIVKCI